MAADALGRYVAEAVDCHACKARDMAAAAFDGPQHGTYWETRPRGGHR